MCIIVFWLSLVLELVESVDLALDDKKVEDREDLLFQEFDEEV